MLPLNPSTSLNLFLQIPRGHVAECSSHWTLLCHSTLLATVILHGPLPWLMWLCTLLPLQQPLRLLTDVLSSFLPLNVNIFFSSILALVAGYTFSLGDLIYSCSSSYQLSTNEFSINVLVPAFYLKPLICIFYHSGILEVFQNQLDLNSMSSFPEYLLHPSLL